MTDQYLRLGGPGQFSSQSKTIAQLPKPSGDEYLRLGSPGQFEQIKTSRSVAAPPASGIDSDALYKCLRGIVKAAIKDDELKELHKACLAEFPKYDVNSTERIGHFLAQVAKESGCMWFLEEQGGDAYFTKHYEGRSDLGNNQPGDGARFKGRGLIQLTGRANYTAFAKKTGIDVVSNPGLVAEYPLAMASALYFWDRERLNEVADKGLTDDVCKKITRIVNGGYNGLEERIKYMHKAKGLLS